MDLEKWKKKGNPHHATELKPAKEMPTEFGKNKWLHPTDGFGKIEEGVANYETRDTYKRKK